MPKREDIQKILILGSGPNIIGQGGEYDLAALQACQALHNQGYSLTVVNSNPATVSTFQDMAEATYIEPLTVKSLTRIIAAKRPDALLPICGGQAALNLTFKLKQARILDEYSVEILGFPFKSLKCCEDRLLFKQTMQQLDFNMPKSLMINSVQGAEKIADQLNYPSLIRACFTTGGTGSSLAYNREELQTLTARALNTGYLDQALIENSLLGWQEFELELIRDVQNQTLTLCTLENIDPVGIHSGDSICVSPWQTIDPGLQNKLQDMAARIADRLQLTGSMHIKFAYDRQSQTIMPISINLRCSRISAISSKMSGIPVAGIASLLASGLTLDEISFFNSSSLDTFKIDPDLVLVKFPNWDFDKFKDAENKLGPQMRSVGEALGLGANFKEALQKALTCITELETETSVCQDDLADYNAEDIFIQTGWPTSRRFFLLLEALARNIVPDKLSEKTSIHPWFIAKLQEIVATKQELGHFDLHNLNKTILAKAKENGISDVHIASILKTSAAKIRNIRENFGLKPFFKDIASNNNAKTQATFYSTCHTHESKTVARQNTVLVLGSGSNRIGEGTGFDTCSYQAGIALGKSDFRSVFVNCNPRAVSTAPDVFDRIYLEPLSAEHLLNICEQEKPQGMIVQFGGNQALQAACALKDKAPAVLGTSLKSMQHGERPELFRNLLKDLGIPQPKSAPASSIEEALDIAQDIGFPLFIKPAQMQASDKNEIILNQEMFDDFFSSHADIANKLPLWIEEFLEFAIEVEADVLADGQDAFVPAIMEHIELAGVHPGDCTWVSPPLSTPPRHMETISTYARNIVQALNIKGLMNIRCAILGDTVYVLEIIPRASRTIPLVSKLCNLDMIALSIRIILGSSLAELGLKQPYLPYYAVKKPAFPFEMLPEVDPLPGTQMQSTGEVMGMSESFGLAFYKAQQATSRSLPLEGSIFLSVTDYDKPSILEPARLFREMGFKLLATEGTCNFLEEYGIRAEPLRKIGAGRPTILDVIKNDQVQLLVNVPTGQKGQKDNARIRKAALEHYLPVISTPADALVAARGILARKQNKIKAISLQELHKMIR